MSEEQLELTPVEKAILRILKSDYDRAVPKYAGGAPVNEVFTEVESWKEPIRAEIRMAIEHLKQQGLVDDLIIRGPEDKEIDGIIITHEGVGVASGMD